MKKKLIAGILALASVFTLASCDKISNLFGKNSSSSQVTTTYDVEGAKGFLQDKYLTKDKEVSTGYDLDTSLVFKGQTYTIAWTVACNVEGVVAIVENEGKVSVQVNSLQLEEDVPYTLTATLTAPDNSTATFTLNRTVKAPSQMVPLAITAAPVEGVTYKLYMYQSTEKYDAYFTGKMSSFYLASSDDYTEAADLTVEYVEGSTTNFNLTFTDANGKQYLGVEEAWNSKNSYWTFNVVFRETPVSSFVWDAELGTITTTVPCRPASENKNGDSPITDQTETKTLYLGTYSTFKTFSASTIDNASKEDTCLANLVTLVNKNELSPEMKVEREKAALESSLTFNGAVEHTLVTAPGTFADVTISWAVKEGTATIENNVLKIAAPDEEASVTLTATITCGTVTDTLDVVVTVFAVPEEITYAQANEIASTLGATDSTKKEYYLTGTVVDVINTTYGNLYIADEEGNTFYVYGTYDQGGKENGKRYDAMADAPQVGDFVKLQGKIATYKGSPQLPDAVVISCTTPDAIPDYAKAVIAARGLELDDVTAAGAVTLPTTAEGGVTIAWVSNNSAIAAVNGGTVTYTLPTGAAVKVTLTATVTCGSFSKDFAFEVMVNPAELPTLTVAEALNADVGATVTVTGTVVKITYAYNSEHDNISVDIADESGTINAYRMKGNVTVGTIIKVTGVIAEYNSVNQIGEGSTFEAIGTHTCTSFTDATCKSAALCVICGTAQVGSAPVDHIYENGACKWCQSPEGVQTQTVAVSIATYASNNGWTDATKYSSLTMNNDITVTATGTDSNTGKYYTNGTNWRMYQKGSPSIVIKAAEGKTIISVQITYTPNNTGCLTLNGENVESDKVIMVNANSIEFSVGNTGTADNGQARITAIEVVYG